METATIALVMLATTGVSVVAVLLLSRFANRLGIIDAPGGRKEHSHHVPLVGGLAIFASVLLGAWGLGIAPQVSWLLFALSIVIAVGFWDDVTEIPPRHKVVLQIIASAIMIWGAGVQLYSVGDLIGWRSIGLSIFAVPMTVFAVIGLVNAVNMMDGIDGLAGSVSLTSFAWFALVAAQSGLQTEALVALLLCSAIAGFLLFNLRFPWQRHARVFLGDAGSLMLGFALAWFAVDLTQGSGRSFPPIAALYVVLLPLADCVSLMIRRLRARKSPFVADRGHIHHYLLARGFSPSQTLAILVGVSVVFGAIGYLAWLLQAREAVLFYPFFFGFFAYHAWISREWERIERRQAGVPSELPEEEQAPAA